MAGASGRSSPRCSNDSGTNLFQRVPSSKPPFTLSEIKKAIPPHCFRRSLLRSSSYLVSDVSIIFFLAYLSTNHLHALPAPLRHAARAGIWIVQGFFTVGLWILAHECGHHAFSEWRWLDDVVGFFIHSSLLVPYFSWKFSHRLHHSNTASMVNDTTLVPKTRAELPWYHVIVLRNPLGRLLVLLSSALAGWPLYLLCNATGRPYDRIACHFDPYSPMFTDRERLLVCVSDAGVLAVGYLLYKLAAAKGLFWIVNVYACPVLVVNAMTLLIIFLQHTHPSLPHYGASEWDWLRGALSTVDRNYGILNSVLHHVGDTHVVHHLLPSMPHYHAVEATRAIKPVLGDYYRFDGTPILKAVWREAKECIYVDAGDEGGPDKNGVYWYANKF